MKQRICIFIVCLLLLAGCHKARVLPPLVSTHDAVTIGVLEGAGSEFDIMLKDGRRIRGELAVKTPKESHDAVVVLINQSKLPQVLLYEKKKDGVWLVDIRLVLCVNDKSCSPISLTQWLRDKRLAWD